MAKQIALDDKGMTTAEENKPGIWYIRRNSPFGGVHTVIMTEATILYLAGLIQERQASGE